jgi:selenide,water dikinase
LSDVYAMGGRPVLALAILGMPVGKMEMEDIRRICAGGADVCASAGVPLAGGHSIDSPEPIYGLVGVGLVDPERVLSNAGAKAGDLLVLTKPIGVGLYSAALRRDALSPVDYAEMIAVTTQLNALGARLPEIAGVHAATDVTGFGLFGHALEMCRASGLRAAIDARAVPLLDRARDFLQEGMKTGASGRNWASYGADVRIGADDEGFWRDLLTDPQTSGGLLVAAAPEAAEAVISQAHAAGFSRAAVIGRFEPGPAGVALV